MSDRNLFESYWQADIAYSAVQVAMDAYQKTGIDDDELEDLFAIVSGDLRIILETLKMYTVNDIQKDPTKPVAS